MLFLSGEQGWNAQLSHSAQLLAFGRSPAGIDSRALFANRSATVPNASFRMATWRTSAISCRRTTACRATSLRCSSVTERGQRRTTRCSRKRRDFCGRRLIDFCPELRLRKPLCEANSLHVVPVRGGRNTLVPDKLDAPWVVLQTHVAACRAADAQRFVQGAPKRAGVALAGCEVRELGSCAVSRCAASRSAAANASDAAAELAGLPIVEVPSKRPATRLLS